MASITILIAVAILWIAKATAGNVFVVGAEFAPRTFLPHRLFFGGIASIYGRRRRSALFANTAIVARAVEHKKLWRSSLPSVGVGVMCLLVGNLLWIATPDECAAILVVTTEAVRENRRIRWRVTAIGVGIGAGGAGGGSVIAGIVVTSSYYHSVFAIFLRVGIRLGIKPTIWRQLGSRIFLSNHKSRWCDYGSHGSCDWVIVVGFLVVVVVVVVVVVITARRDDAGGRTLDDGSVVGVERTVASRVLLVASASSVVVAASHGHSNLFGFGTKSKQGFGTKKQQMTVD